MVERASDLNLPRLCVIGLTGSGKSATCNSLCGRLDYFKSSANSESVTLTTSIH